MNLTIRPDDQGGPADPDATPDDEPTAPVAAAAAAGLADDGSRPAPTARERLSARLPEIAVIALAALVNTWALAQNGIGNTYYAATVRSMGASFHNFLYGSYDPGGWITTDKPPFAYWVGTIFTKVFGYSDWTLLLPSAIAGVLAVVLLMATIRPFWGRAAALSAGLALALTPAMVAVSRSNNPDAMLVLLTVAAAWATTKAIADGRYRWLLAAGAFVGMAFLTKLLAGFVALPALWLAYLVAGTGTWKRRMVQLVAATAVVVAIGGAWVALVDLTPATQRPYIGSSTDGTALDVVLGYNGLGRIFGQTDALGGGGPGFGGGAPGGGGGAGMPGGGFPGGGGFAMGTNGIDQFGGSPGLGRLFNNGMGDQVMWLLPAAVVSALAALVAAIRQRRRDGRLGTVIIFFGWLVITAVVFSTAKGIFHNYYVSFLAPPIAALAGIGIAQLRQAGWLGRAAAVVALLATAALQVVLLDRVAAWEWLRVVAPVGLAIAAVGLILSVLLGRTPAGAPRRLVPAVAVAALVFALLAPAAWSLSTWQRPANGTFPDARPVDAGGGGPGAGPAGMGFGGSLSDAELTWLRDQQTTERWILAVSSSMEASVPISDGFALMAMGGFSGTDPAMTQDRLAELVDAGELRFVAGGGGLGFGASGSSVTSIVADVCEPVPTSSWDPGATGDSSVFDCKGKGAAIREAVVDTSSAAPLGAGQAPGGLPGAGGFPGAGGQVPGLPAGTDPSQLMGCLAEQGVDLGNGPPAQVDDTLRDAMKACGLDAAAITPPGGATSPSGGAATPEPTP